MRQIYIDLTSDNTKQVVGKSIGFMGEHNATELLITIPQTMLDESDYAVVLFQSGSFTYRSRRIYPDSDNESAYRIGNCIHCLLGRHLTGEPFLGLQVECYKLGSDGEPTLIGKTAFVSKLMLKPSPKGKSGLSFDGSPEDLQSAIDKTHSHINISSLVKVGENESGRFTFDGREISGGGIASYESYSLLPENAPDGTLAYVENDDTPQSVGVVNARTEYPIIRVRETPDITALDNMTLVTSTESHEDEPPSYFCEMYMERPGSDEYPCYIQCIHIPGMASLFMVGELEKDRIARAYVPGGRDEYSGYPFYVYNFIDNFDISLMTDEAVPQICPIGWYKVTEKRINYRVENGYLDYDYQTIIEPIAFADTPLVQNFVGCSIGYYEDDEDGRFVNESELSFMLSKLFAASSVPVHEKGLYLCDGGEWHRFKSGNVTVVTDRMSLPEEADEGDFALVQASSYVYNRDSGQWTCVGNSFNAIYVNPCLNNLARLYDVELSASYGCYGTDPNTGTYGFIPNGGGGFELVTNIANNYALLSISPYNWTPERNHYIYSWTEQTLSFSSGSSLGNSSAVEIPLSVGWNKVNIESGSGEFRGVSLIEDPEDLPTLTVDNYSGNPTYVYCFTTCTCSWSINGFTQNIINSRPYFTQDNAAGLWGYAGGTWQKL